MPNMARGPLWLPRSGSSSLGQRRGTKGRTKSRRRRSPLLVYVAIVLVVLPVVLLAGIGIGALVGTRILLSADEQAGSSEHHTSLRRHDAGGVVFPPRYPVVSSDRRGGEGAAAAASGLSPEALEMCGDALWHTLRTTTIVLPNDDSFVHTGDIDDLWLRDSAAQVHPLLIPWFPGGKGALVSRDARLARVVSGLVRRSAFYIRHDPYANAFRIDTSYEFSEEQKKMGRHDYISTWNYELDSGCYYVRMLYFFWRALPEAPILREQAVFESVSMMVDLWTAEQDHEGDAYPTGPLFDCQNCAGPYRYPGLANDGKGRPTTRTGMTWTGFRPSDDECTYGYLVPANMFAVVALGYAAELAQTLWADRGGADLARRATKLASEIDEGIKQYGIVEHPNHGRIYAYEVDGLGNSLLMDDANVPSLLSAPYLGYNYDPEVYANTRRFIFSHDNPTYQSGTNKITGQIEGYGSPHMKGAIAQNIWPMSLAVRGLTSDAVGEKVEIINQLVKASAGTHWMHESFDVKKPKKFTRAWFCWADALFAELVMSVTDSCPRSDQKYVVGWWRDPELPEGGVFADLQPITTE